jgi:IS1 family transposase
LETIPLAGIARATNVSDSGLQTDVNACYEAVPKAAEVIPKAKGKLKVQMDELWFFVDHKGNKQWVWVMIEADTREIIGCHIGARSRASAIALWQSIPAVYRQCAKVYTDDWEAYVTVIPSKRHAAVGKDSGLTNYIERLNNTLRQRISWLVRKTLSFSKKLENHIGAIWLVIHDYNRRVREKLAEREGFMFSSVLY